KPKPVFTSLNTFFCKGDAPIDLVGDAPGFVGGGFEFKIGSTVVTKFDPGSAKLGDNSINMTFTSNDQCVGSADTIVNVSDLPSVTMTNQQYCSGAAATIGVPLNSNFNYTWDPSPDISTPTSNEVTIRATNNTASPITKTYQLTVTSKTNSACTNKGPVSLEIKPVPVASFTGLPSNGQCLNSPDIILAGSHSNGAFSSTSDALIGTNTFTSKTAGSKSIKYTVSVDNCIDDTTIIVVVHPLPQPQILGIDKAIYCADEPSLSITGTNPAGGTLSNNGNVWAGGSFPLNTAGNYTFKYTATDENGCVNFVEKSLTVKALPVVSVTPVDPICDGNAAVIAASGGETYQWTGLAETSNVIMVRPRSTTTYEVRAVNRPNCISTPITVTVSVNSTPSARFNERNIVHCFDDGEIKLSAGLAPSYLWSNGSTSDTIQINEGGFYKVTLTAGFCSSADSVHIVAYCPPRIFLPQAFTPNGDGTNDQFEIFGDHFENFEMKIFNRWGEVVYTTKDRYKPWDGRYLDQDMPGGVYPWVVTYESKAVGRSQKSSSLNGSVTLVR
ncbi:MAG TPA: gliding motility-associated C-terminal domain-containing protein, partial [Cytophagaceae bacterium]